jgi:hypothetical protein
MNTGVKPVGVVPDGAMLADYSFSDSCWEYLDKMRELCAENDTELILVKAPTIYPHWYAEWDAQIRAYAEKYGLRYFNFLEKADEIGIDWAADTYDAGLHLNVYGAEKLTRYFGGLLNREVQRDLPEYDALAERYYAERNKK